MLLELEDISVHYGGVVALDGVSLGVEEGEIVALMGPNGAGKSTVLKAIFGLAPVASGRIYWREQPLETASHEIVKFGLAFVPQGRRVFTHLSIEDNLELGCLYLRDTAEKRRRMEEVMELFPVLHDKRREKARDMSGGEQQMLAIGRGLMANINSGVEAVFNNLAGATFDIRNNRSFLNNQGEDPTQFNNLAGDTFQKSAGAGTTTISVAFDNTGTVLNTSDGILTFTNCAGCPA